MSLRSIGAGLFLALAGVALVGACDDTPRRVVIGAGGDDGVADASPAATSTGPGITAPEDAGAPPPEQPSHGACVATECPADYDSCPDNLGRLPPYACQTTLKNDDANCGACGVVCPPQAGFVGMRISCVEGSCVAACNDRFLDCNGIVDDGCEVNLDANDPNNCGGCGIACAEGTACVGGTCGCPAGKTNCGGLCVDLADDDNNCGQCNFLCLEHQPEDAGEPTPHTTYKCNEGTCSRRTCVQNTDEHWEDCNGDPSDGCEVNVASRDEAGFADPNNCGACGKTCSDGRRCFDPGLGTGPQCECATGATICPGPSCADLENDPNNCGGCGTFCPSPVVDFSSGNGAQTCEHGHCGFACSQGFANCNDTMGDGCEADLLRDPRNCGGCGITCDLAAGQPCFNGQCLMTDCDGEIR